MNSSLSEMFRKSTYNILEGKYIFAKVAKAPEFSNHFMVSQDGSEITVVTKVENIKELEVLEKNKDFWKLISLNLFTPYTAGTLAAINSACAERGLNNLVISTYSKDYIIVKDEKLSEIKEVLQKLGFNEK